MLITNFNIFESSVFNYMDNFKNSLMSDNYVITNKITIDVNPINGEITINNIPTKDYMSIPAYIRSIIDTYCNEHNYKKGTLFNNKLVLKYNFGTPDEFLDRTKIKSLDGLTENISNISQLESVSDSMVVFDDERKLNYYKKLWDSLNVKYTQYNKFFPKLFKQMMEKKKLSRLQWAELEYLLKNGKSRYDAGILPKNYL